MTELASFLPLRTLQGMEVRDAQASLKTFSDIVHMKESVPILVSALPTPQKNSMALPMDPHSLFQPENTEPEPSAPCLRLQETFIPLLRSCGTDVDRLPRFAGHTASEVVASLRRVQSLSPDCDALTAFVMLDCGVDASGIVPVLVAARSLSKIVVAGLPLPVSQLTQEMIQACVPYCAARVSNAWVEGARSIEDMQGRACTIHFAELIGGALAVIEAVLCLKDNRSQAGLDQRIIEGEGAFTCPTPDSLVSPLSNLVDGCVRALQLSREDRMHRSVTASLQSCILRCVTCLSMAVHLSAPGSVSADRIASLCVLSEQLFALAIAGSSGAGRYTSFLLSSPECFAGSILTLTLLNLALDSGAPASYCRLAEPSKCIQHVLHGLQGAELTGDSHRKLASARVFMLGVVLGKCADKQTIAMDQNLDGALRQVIGGHSIGFLLDVVLPCICTECESPMVVATSTVDVGSGMAVAESLAMDFLDDMVGVSAKALPFLFKTERGKSGLSARDMLQLPVSRARELLSLRLGDSSSLTSLLQDAGDGCSTWSTFVTLLARSILACGSQQDAIASGLAAAVCAQVQPMHAASGEMAYVSTLSAVCEFLCCVASYHISSRQAGHSVQDFLVLGKSETSVRDFVRSQRANLRPPFLQPKHLDFESAVSYLLLWIQHNTSIVDAGEFDSVTIAHQYTDLRIKASQEVCLRSSGRGQAWFSSESGSPPDEMDAVMTEFIFNLLSMCAASISSDPHELELFLSSFTGIMCNSTNGGNFGSVSLAKLWSAPLPSLFKAGIVRMFSCCLQSLASQERPDSSRIAHVASVIIPELVKSVTVLAGQSGAMNDGGGVTPLSAFEFEWRVDCESGNFVHTTELLHLLRVLVHVGPTMALCPLVKVVTTVIMPYLQPGSALASTAPRTALPLLSVCLHVLVDVIGMLDASAIVTLQSFSVDSNGNGAKDGQAAAEQHLAIATTSMILSPTNNPGSSLPHIALSSLLNLADPASSPQISPFVASTATAAASLLCMTLKAQQILDKSGRQLSSVVDSLCDLEEVLLSPTALRPLLQSLATDSQIAPGAISGVLSIFRRLIDSQSSNRKLFNVLRSVSKELPPVIAQLASTVVTAAARGGEIPGVSSEFSDFESLVSSASEFSSSHSVRSPDTFKRPAAAGNAGQQTTNSREPSEEKPLDYFFGIQVLGIIAASLESADGSGEAAAIPLLGLNHGAGHYDLLRAVITTVKSASMPIRCIGWQIIDRLLSSNDVELALRAVDALDMGNDPRWALSWELALEAATHSQSLRHTAELTLEEASDGDGEEIMSQLCTALRCTGHSLSSLSQRMWLSATHPGVCPHLKFDATSICRCILSDCMRSEAAHSAQSTLYSTNLSLGGDFRHNHSINSTLRESDSSGRLLWGVVPMKQALPTSPPSIPGLKLEQVKSLVILTQIEHLKGQLDCAKLAQRMNRLFEAGSAGLSSSAAVYSTPMAPFLTPSSAPFSDVSGVDTTADVESFIHRQIVAWPNGYNALKRLLNASIISSRGCRRLFEFVLSPSAAAWHQLPPSEMSQLGLVVLRFILGSWERLTCGPPHGTSDVGRVLVASARALAAYPSSDAMAHAPDMYKHIMKLIARNVPGDLASKAAMAAAELARPVLAVDMASGDVSKFPILRQAVMKQHSLALQLDPRGTSASLPAIASALHAGVGPLSQDLLGGLTFGWSNASASQLGRALSDPNTFHWNWLLFSERQRLAILARLLSGKGRTRDLEYVLSIMASSTILQSDSDMIIPPAVGAGTNQSVIRRCAARHGLWMAASRVLYIASMSSELSFSLLKCCSQLHAPISASVMQASCWPSGENLQVVDDRLCSVSPYLACLWEAEAAFACGCSILSSLQSVPSTNWPGGATLVIHSLDVASRQMFECENGLARQQAIYKPAGEGSDLISRGCAVTFAALRYLHSRYSLAPGHSLSSENALSRGNEHQLLMSANLAVKGLNQVAIRLKSSVLRDNSANDDSDAIFARCKAEAEPLLRVSELSISLLEIITRAGAAHADAGTVQPGQAVNCCRQLQRVLTESGLAAPSALLQVCLEKWSWRDKETAATSAPPSAL